MKKKEFSKTNLSKFYKSSPLFKKYCGLGLWFGSLEEFNNIRYCEKYLQKYTRALIKHKLLRDVNLISCSNLIKNAHFVKFLESGFLRYTDSHFLLIFHENSFLFSLAKSKTKIETFVNSYHQTYLKDELEKDLLSCILKPTQGFMFSFSETHLINFRIYSLLKKYDFCIKNRNTLKNQSISEYNKIYLKLLKKKDIQLLFESLESIGLFDSFKEKKESVGPHCTANIVIKTSLNPIKNKCAKTFNKIF